MRTIAATNPASARAIAWIVGVNLGLFVLVTSLPAFRSAHHHWIFPVLAGLLGGQWLLALSLRGESTLIEPAAARDAIVSLLAFLLVMGIIRHATILTCFDRCSFKLAAAAVLAAPVFLAQSRLEGSGFWDPLRASLAAVGASAWALYLALRGLQVSPWLVDLGFSILALVLWLGRARAVFLISALGIAAGLAVRATGNELAIIGLSVLWAVAVPLASAHRVEAWLQGRAAAPAPEPGAGGWRRSAVRIAAVIAVVAGLGVYAVGPTFLMTNPVQRRARLAGMAPALPIQDPRSLSPLASRLRAHVAMLAQEIGERDAYQRKNQERARDYILAELRAAGYAPKVLEYRSRFMPAVKDGTAFSNVEAILEVAGAGGAAWVVGAHYDSAPGTPGADDNASGVAVLLETARLLRNAPPGRAVRFVAFGTEEPPAFGTRNMGSSQYARRLKDNGSSVHGMISLEMLGYFNPRRGSQLYPPFMHLLYPDHGDYVGVVANVESRALLDAFEKGWRGASSFPLFASILPGPFSSLALSDQLSFWDLGYPAVMISDTAFYRNPHYHQETDLADTLDYEKMAQVARALAGALRAR